MSTTPRAASLVAALALGLAACGDRGAPAPTEKRGVDATLIVRAPDAKGHRAATLHVTPTMEVQNATVHFDVPDGCDVVAGATVRHVPSLPAGKPFEVSVVFSCPDRPRGTVDLELTGKTADGQVVTRSLRATF
jgi:hypothetical protein